MSTPIDDVSVLQLLWTRANGRSRHEFMKLIDVLDPPPQSQRDPFGGALKIWARLSEAEQATLRGWFKTHIAAS